jgi:hypothetical protein
MIRNTIRNAALAAATALFAAIPAAAQSVEFKAVEAKNLGTKHKIDPAKGYILVSSPTRSVGTFIKTPDDADRAEYQVDWDKGFAKAQKKYASAMKSWEQDRAAKRPTGDKPIEPTPATFSIGEIERRLTVGFGPMFVFEKAENNAVSYLIEVEPGTYTYYGPISLLPNGAAFGTCYCMGSVKFEVKPGVIANLGDFLSGGWVSDEAVRLAAAVPPPPGRVPVPVSYPVPAALSQYRVENAELRAAGKMNNFFGLTVQRMPPVEGVLGYDRDKVIDLRAP